MVGGSPKVSGVCARGGEPERWAKNAVSAICTCYNSSPEELKRSIRSMLAQTYSGIEIIVVDDGSRTPFSGVDLDPEFRDRDITWTANGRNLGVAGARNVGIRGSQGTFVAFLDAGDWWEPRKIEIQMAALRKEGNAGYGLAFTSAAFHYGSKVRVVRARGGQDILRGLMVGQPVSGSASSVLVRRSVFERVGLFDESQDLPEDRDMWLRIALAHGLLGIDECLTHIEVRAQSRSSDPRIKETTYLLLLEKHRELIEQAGLWPTALAHYHVVISRKYAAVGDVRRALHHAGKGLAEDPGFLLRGITKQFVRRLRGQ